MITTDCQDYKIINIFGNDYILNLDTGEVLKCLNDVNSSGNKRDWKKFKVDNLLLSDLFEMLSEREDNTKYFLKRSARLADCSTRLFFNRYEKGLKLIHGSSCRVRLCPVCGWRRSLKIQANFKKILESMDLTKYDFIVMTLTCRNCWEDDLSSTIDRLLEGYRLLCKDKFFRSAVLGTYRGLEVTRNHDRYKFDYFKNSKGKKYKKYKVDKTTGSYIDNPWYGSYHPHLHCILCVDKSYCKSSKYISRDRMLDMWRKYYGDDKITQLDMRFITPRKKDLSVSSSMAEIIMSGVVEVAKYTVKSDDILSSSDAGLDYDMSMDTVKCLDQALARRRLVSFGGLLRDIHRQLKLDDEIDGDLVQIGDSSTELGELLGHTMAFWHVGYNNYISYDYD